ncbi:hypothetical protein AMTRI_Chr01g105220 [Amborella trichopoda]
MNYKLWESLPKLYMQGFVKLLQDTTLRKLRGNSKFVSFEIGVHWPTLDLDNHLSLFLSLNIYVYAYIHINIYIHTYIHTKKNYIRLKP